MAVSVNQAVSFYTKNRNKFPGMTMSQAVDQMVRGGEIPVAPVEAAPAAPVAAALAAAAPAPAPMAAPAPVDVDVVETETAPAPAPKYMNQYENALAAFNLANPETAAPAPVKGKPVDYAAMARQAVKDRQRQELEANVEISRNAQIDPDTQKIIDDRLARYGIELTQADKDRQQATWMAVAQAGMKMAQSQSPYFMQALASGMEAGIDGYSEAKAKAAEKKARLQDSKEELSMKAIELRAQAVKDAIGMRLAAKQGAAADTALQKDALGVIVGEQTADEVIEGAGLENAYKRVSIRNMESQIGERAAAGARAAAAARNPGGAGGVKLSQLNPIVNGAISENDRLTEQLNDPIISSQLSPTQKRSMQGKIQSNNQIIAYGRSLQRQKIGMGGMTFGQEK
jgi:hypothetical protein